MKADPSAASQTTHPPLAHDVQGFKIAVPPGTTHWRILRQTGGRPKPVPGHDMQPARFGLELTHEELLDVCGPGKYRIEALDEYGNPLACITNVTVGGEAPAAVAEPAGGAAGRASTAHDLRIALETIAQMSRAHSESLQSLATAQADWIKMLATSKAIPRNGTVQIAPAYPETSPTEPKPSWLTLLEPAMPAIATAVIRNVGSFLGPKQDVLPKRRNAAPVEPISGIATAFLRERKALEAAPVRPTFDEHAATVCALLAPEDRERATQIMTEWVKPLFLEMFLSMTPAKGAELLRSLIASSTPKHEQDAS